MQATPDPQSSGQPQPARDATNESSIDPLVVEALIAEKRSQQSLPMALAAGGISAMVAAAIWAAITVSTGYQIGWIAVGVGFLVGFAVRYAGKGIDPIYGYIGAGFSLLGCLVGNVLSVVGFVSLEDSQPFFELLGRVDLTLAAELLTATFSPIDLLFYGIAIYQGYQFSFVRITADELTKAPAG